MATVLPLASTICIVISAILVAFGWAHILRGRKDTHKKLMLTGAAFALIFFLIYVSKMVFFGDTHFAGPESIKPYYLAFLLFHIVLATVAAVFGLTTIYLGLSKKFEKHRRLGRVTATIWFLSATTGVTVYLLLYVFFPQN